MSFAFLYMFIVMVFWRPQEWLVPWLFGLPILDALTYGAILAMMLEYSSGRLKLNFREPQYFLYVGLFVAGLMSHLSWFYWEGLMNSWLGIFRLTFFGILLFACMQSPRHLRWIARAFVVMAVVMAVHAVLQDIRGYGFAGQRPILSWRPNVDYLVPRTRFFGIFDDPNDMGQFLATAMPLCFVWFKRTNVPTKVFGAALIFVIYQGFETTLSRGSQVGLLATVGVVLAMLVFRRRYLWVLGAGFLGGLMLIPVSGRFLGSAWERINLWGQANYAFKTKPIFGVGLGMQTDYLDEAKVAHNAYVAAYMELGVFGFFFWMTLIFLAAAGLLQTRKALRNAEGAEAEWLYRFSLWGFAAMTGFFVSAFFLSRSFVFPLYFLTAMMGAVPFVAQNYVPEGEVHKLGFSIKESTILGIPISLAVIFYVYLAVVILNMQR